MNSEAANVVGLYERHARNWDKDRGRDLFEKPWLDSFLRFVPARGSILGIGCGSADTIARFFNQQGYEVAGVDSAAVVIGI